MKISRLKNKKFIRLNKDFLLILAILDKISKKSYPGLRLRLHQTQVVLAFAFDFFKRNPDKSWIILNQRVDHMLFR